MGRYLPPAVVVVRPTAAPGSTQRDGPGQDSWYGLRQSFTDTSGGAEKGPSSSLMRRSRRCCAVVFRQPGGGSRGGSGLLQSRRQRSLSRSIPCRLGRPGRACRSGVARPRQFLRLLNARSTTLRPLWSSASKSTGPVGQRDPRFLRWPIWSAGSGISAVMPPERRTARVAGEEYALSPAQRLRSRPWPTRSLTWNAQLGQQQLQRRRVTGLPPA